MSSEDPIFLKTMHLTNSTTWCGSLHTAVTVRDVKSKGSHSQRDRSCTRSRRISLGCFERRSEGSEIQQLPIVNPNCLGVKNPQEYLKQPILEATNQTDKQASKFKRSKSTCPTNSGAGGLLRRLRRRTSEKFRSNTPSGASPPRNIHARSSSTPKFPSTQSMSRSCYFDYTDAYQRHVWRSASTMVNTICCDAAHQRDSMYVQPRCPHINPCQCDNPYTRCSSPSVRHQIVLGPYCPSCQMNAYRQQGLMPCQSPPATATLDSVPSFPGFPNPPGQVVVTDGSQAGFVAWNQPPTPCLQAPRPNSYFEETAMPQLLQNSAILKPSLASSFHQGPDSDAVTCFSGAPIPENCSTFSSPAQWKTHQEKLYESQAAAGVGSNHDSIPSALHGSFTNQATKTNTFNVPSSSSFSNLSERQVNKASGCCMHQTDLNATAEVPLTTPTLGISRSQLAMAHTLPLCQTQRPDSLLSMFSTTGESSTSDSLPNSSSSHDSAIGGNCMTEDSLKKYDNQKRSKAEIHPGNGQISQREQLIHASRPMTVNQLVSGTNRPHTRTYPLPLPTQTAEEPRLPPTPRRHVWIPHPPMISCSVVDDLAGVGRLEPVNRRMRAERRQHAIYVNADIPPPSLQHVSASTTTSHSNGTSNGQQHESHQQSAIPTTPWTHLLPYRASTVPQNLSERLKKSETLPNDIWDQVRRPLATTNCGQACSHSTGLQAVATAAPSDPSSLNWKEEGRAVRKLTSSTTNRTVRPKSSPPRPPVRSTSQVVSTAGEPNQRPRDDFDSELSRLSLHPTTQAPPSTLPQSVVTLVEESPLLCKYSQLYSLQAAPQAAASGNGHQGGYSRLSDLKLRKFAVMHARPAPQS